jgi:arylsulfatase A-like enzyme
MKGVSMINKCSLCAFFASIAGYSAAASTPNVVFFLVDDMGWMDCGCYGSRSYETPNIDRLAGEGMRFTQAYTAFPRCAPARQALMTGRFPARNGSPGRDEAMSASEFTLAEAMKAGGYATFFAGKWHIGKVPEQMPENQGFDVNIAGGEAGSPPSYFFPYNKVREAGHKTEGDICGLDEGREGEYLTDRLTDETISFISRHRTEKPHQPFFVYLSHYAVHTPFEAKPELISYCENKLRKISFDGPEYVDRDGTTKVRQDNAVYAAMIKSMDESLGRVMDTLEKLGIADSTVIVLTGDNGGLSNRGADSNRRLATSNLPLRAGKGHCYEGGIREPMIVKWPGTVKPGTVSDDVVTGTDHYPAILEIAGLPLRPQQHLDGFSYVPALKGGTLARPAPIFWHSPSGRPNQTGDINCTAMRDGDWKLLDFYDENRVELYNLKTDPYETRDLSKTDADRTVKMLEAVRSWRKEINAVIKTKPSKK